MESPDVFSCTVVIVTWNARDVVRECLASLAPQLGSAGSREIVVVDNGSNDETVQMLAREFPHVRVIASPLNLGFAAGANLGIAAAHHDTVVLLNNDATADPGFLDALLIALQARPEAAAVTARLVLADRYSRAEIGGLVDSSSRHWARDDTGIELINSTGGELTRSGNGRDRDWLVPVTEHARPAGDVLAFSGGAAALRRSAFNEVGAFDERYFMYYEDSDLSWRLRRAGWQIHYEPTATVRHRHAASSGTESDFFLFHNHRNRVLFALKNLPAGLAVLTTARALVAVPWRALRLRSSGAGARRDARALCSAWALAPAFLRSRRLQQRTARLSRRTVGRLLVRD